MIWLVNMLIILLLTFWYATIQYRKGELRWIFFVYIFFKTNLNIITIRYVPHTSENCSLRHVTNLRVRSHERQNELIPVWDFKPAWKQVLLTWSFISAAFQNDPIFWWTCAGISFQIMFTWYFITRNEISFLSRWPLWNPYPHLVSNAHAH